MKKSLLKKLHLKGKKDLSRLDRFILGLVSVGGVFLILFAAQAAYFYLPQAPVSDYLPAKDTVAYLNLSDVNAPFKLGVDDHYNELSEVIGNLFQVELKSMIDRFGTGRVSLVLIKNESGDTQPVLLIQAKSKRSALHYFEGMLLEGEKLVISQSTPPLYSFPQGQDFSFKFLDRYVAISSNNQLLEKLEETPETRLGDEAQFQKSINNLPRNSWLTGYVNFGELSLSGNPAIQNVLEPLKTAINHFAFTVRKDQEGLQFNTFLNLNKDLLSLKAGEAEEKFAYRLTDYILDDGLGLYIGGSDLEAEWINTLETISHLNPAYGIIMEGLVRAQVDRIFGQNVDLRNDLYPLFEGEYALALGNGTVGKTITLVLAHKDKKFTETKLKKMEQGFKFLAANFAPQILRVPLPDGTESEELIPDDSQVTDVNETIDGFNVRCTGISDSTAGFCYTVTDEIVIITNSKDILMNTIKPNSGKGFLGESVPFRKSLANLSKVNDELSFVNFENLMKFFSHHQMLQLAQPLTSNFDSASWVKHYFDDGVSAEGYVLLK